MNPNRLVNEKSPYLLQHAFNPVDWYPWSDEAFRKARLEDKPVFLSIGYSTCHWCHVMERESFEDKEVAALLNDVFVNIKVDREERPDIDAVYMKVCHLMTQSGGWPLTIIMTPDKEPFFAATYLPKKARYGRLGMMELIPKVKDLWKTKRASLVSAAAEITGALRRTSTVKSGDVSEETLHRAYRALSDSFDRTFGGFGQAPKFPSPHHFFFLLRYWKRTGDTQALHMAEHTLQNMRRGGMYDHVGFGFHRYSTDERWIVPHFEKMLYDQALLSMAYIELFQATGKAEYANTAREIFTYVLRDLTGGQGGFYCAEDADSEGMEGKFYLWSDGEIRRILTKQEADRFLLLYRHSDDADVPGMHDIPDGLFIPHLTPGQDNQPDLPGIRSPLQSIREKLFDAREQRTHPHKDDKILTDWNGLMIAALASGARVLDEPAYAEAAIKAMDFILRFMQTDRGHLLHRYRDGKASIKANIDDYSFTIWALLELYETTFRATYLQNALQLHARLFDRFQDDKDGGLFFTSSDAEALLTRPKELYDGAVPSGNSVALMNTQKLFRITGNPAVDRQAQSLHTAFRAPAGAMPAAFTHYLCGLDFAIGPSSEVVITGEIHDPDTSELLRALKTTFAPNKVVLFRPAKPEQPDIETIAPFIRPCTLINGKATAYVCSGFACAPPTHDPQTMIGLIKK